MEWRMRNVFLAGFLVAFAIGGSLALAALTSGIAPSVLALAAGAFLGHALVTGLLLSAVFGLLDDYEDRAPGHPSDA